MTEKTKTCRPLISLLDDGTLQFEIETDELFLTFLVSRDDIPAIISRLDTLWRWELYKKEVFEI